MPKIYNALITTKEKLLPSEAYPATTGPVFQPIGLTGEPVLLNPEDFIKKSAPQPGGEEVPGSDTQPEGETNAKKPAPIVFYPRYSVYYPHQPYIPFQQPIVYTSFQNNQNPVQTKQDQPQEPQPELTENNPEPEANPNPDSYAPLPGFPPVRSLPPAPSGFPYVKNNSPKNIGVPDVPPPPPPVGIPKQEESER